MSEYQYHEWQAIDRLLSPQEQEHVEQLSSHIKVSASRAVVTYHWSDFKYDPKKVLLKYFDAYLYFANWGTIRLLFRFPQGLIDESAVAPYCDDEYITFENSGNYQVLGIYFDPEYGEGWMQAEAGLSSFVGLRDDLLSGDYRLLYLAWLAKGTLFDVDSDILEPPVPPGLKNMSPGLSHFIAITELDPFLLRAAAEESDELEPSQPIDYAKLIRHLTRAECDTFLIDLANGRSGVAHALRQRLQSFLPSKRPLAPRRPRTLAQLKQRAKTLQLAEKQRRDEIARKKHAQEMEVLSRREDQAWKEVEHLLEHGRRIASVYDDVTEKLVKLQQLAENKNNYSAFEMQIQKLVQRYATRPALMRRWRSKGWIR